MTRRSLFKAALIFISAYSVSSAAKKPYHRQIVARACTGCKECLTVCPAGAIEMIRGKAEIDPNTCTNCLLCDTVCSYGAVQQCKRETIHS